MLVQPLRILPINVQISTSNGEESLCITEALALSYKKDSNGSIVATEASVGRRFATFADDSQVILAKGSPAQENSN